MPLSLLTAHMLLTAFLFYKNFLGARKTAFRFCRRRRVLFEEQNRAPLKKEDFMNFSTLNKAIFEQTELPDNAVIADLGCRDAAFLQGFVEAFPGKISKAVGVDITDTSFGRISFSDLIELHVMDCSKKLDFPDNTFDFVFSKDMFECVTDKSALVSEIHSI